MVPVLDCFSEVVPEARLVQQLARYGKRGLGGTDQINSEFPPRTLLFFSLYNVFGHLFRVSGQTFNA